MNSVRSLVILACLFLVMSTATAQQSPPSPKGTQKLMKDTKGKVKVRADKKTGKAKFVRIPPRSMPASMITDRAAATNARAKEFFREYGNAFGVDKPDTELKPHKTSRDATGAEHTVLKQTHEQIPVFGGELRAHFDPAGELYAANGNFVDGIKVNMTPRVSIETARQVAISTVQSGPRLAARGQETSANVSISLEAHKQT